MAIPRVGLHGRARHALPAVPPHRAAAPRHPAPSLPAAEPLEPRCLLAADPAQFPFRLKPGRAPGLLQVENFDYGGQDVAYREVARTSRTPLYRRYDSVDIARAIDGGEGFCVWASNREWLEYTINVTTTGIYDLSVRVASPGPGGTFHLEVDGARVTKRLLVPNTRGMQRWTTLQGGAFHLTAGRHVLRLAMSSNGSTGYTGSFNWLTLTSATPAAPVGLTATARSESQIDLAWQDQSSNESGFTLERKDQTQTEWQLIAQLPANTTTFADTDLEPGLRYEYRVRATNGATSSAYSAPAAASTLFGGPLLITSGGTYSGRWQSLDPSVPAISIRTSEPVIIEDSIIYSRGPLIEADGHVDLIVRRTAGFALHPGVAGVGAGRFLSVDGFVNVLVENNYLEGTSGIYLHNYVGNHSTSQTVRILRNEALNIDGRLTTADAYLATAGPNPPVQFFQLDGANDLPGVEIAWNQVVNEPGNSLVEDNISIYASSGTPFSPILIHDNYIQGAYAGDPARDADYSGGGIMLADHGSAYVWAYSNHVINTSNYGIAIASGHDNHIYINRVLSSGLLPDGTPIAAQNTGIYIWNHENEPSFARNAGHNNLVGWQSHAQRNDWWVPDAASFLNNTSWPGTVTRTTEAAEWDLWLARIEQNGIVVGMQTTQG